MLNTLHQELLRATRASLRTCRYSQCTEKAYLGCVRRFLEFTNSQTVTELSPERVRDYIDYIVREHGVGASTRNQVLAAVSFFYTRVLGTDPSWFDRAPRGKRPRSAPLTLTRAEVGAVLSQLQGTHRLMGGLLYGSGLRLLECCRLRIKDLNFERRTVSVCSTGPLDRTTLLPASMIPDLKAHLKAVAHQHREDLQQGAGGVDLPDTVRTKHPGASHELPWQWLFPARRIQCDPVTGVAKRHHRHESGLQRAIKVAVSEAGLNKPATCHSLRHSFALHLLEAGYDRATLQQLLGLRDSGSTLVYEQLLATRRRGFHSTSGAAPVREGADFRAMAAAR